MSRLLPRLFWQSRPLFRSKNSTYKKHKSSLRGLESLEDRLALSAASVAGDGAPVVEFAIDTPMAIGLHGQHFNSQR